MISKKHFIEELELVHRDVTRELIARIGKAKSSVLVNQLEHYKNTIIKIAEKQPIVATPAEWIPCSERLPEEDGEYLVWYDCGEENDGDSECGFMIVPFWTDVEMFGAYESYYHAETLGFLDTDFIECETAVAWMPLPEPYKGE